ncbi:unnamed protein product [Pylaiella littoralis]
MRVALSRFILCLYLASRDPGAPCLSFFRGVFGLGLILVLVWYSNVSCGIAGCRRVGCSAVEAFVTHLESVLSVLVAVLACLWISIESAACASIVYTSTKFVVFQGGGGRERDIRSTFFLLIGAGIPLVHLRNGGGGVGVGRAQEPAAAATPNTADTTNRDRFRHVFIPRRWCSATFFPSVAGWSRPSVFCWKTWACLSTSREGEGERPPRRMCETACSRPTALVSKSAPWLL